MNLSLYNEIDPFCVEWLRNLMAAGEIPDGDIDERSITELRATDIVGYRQFHTFCGIAGWPEALRLAEWPSEWEVWTGSCPCQPFSVSGRQQGTKDERHLWPFFRDLIEDGRPAVVFGEQVASAMGREWLAGVRSDLAAMGYVVGAADLCSPCEGGPHIRQRLYWGAVRLGDVFSERLERYARDVDRGNESRRIASAANGSIATSGSWSDSTVVQCLDGKGRRVGAGVQPLDYGVPRDMGRRKPELQRLLRPAGRNRVGRLKAYGNAIVPQLAAAFVREFMASVYESGVLR